MTTSHADIKVFEADGSPRTVPDEERATLTQEQNILLNLLQEAAKAEQVAAADHAKASKRLHAAVRARDAVSVERDKMLPRISRFDELARMGMWHH